MLLSLKHLHHFKIHAIDGDFGQAEQFLFDSKTWSLRYIIVKIGNWFQGRRHVLVDVNAIEKIDDNNSIINLRMTREKIETCVDIDLSSSIIRDVEKKYLDEHHWPDYWINVGIWGAAPNNYGDFGVPFEETLATEENPNKVSLHLAEFLFNFELIENDGQVGHVEDFLFDDLNFKIRYLVIDTKRFWNSESLLLAPQWVKKIDWNTKKLTLGFSKDLIETCPRYTTGMPIDRAYESNLYHHFGQKEYWSSSPRAPSTYSKEPPEHQL